MSTADPIAHEARHRGTTASGKTEIGDKSVPESEAHVKRSAGRRGYSLVDSIMAEVQRINSDPWPIVTRAVFFLGLLLSAQVLYEAYEAISSAPTTLEPGPPLQGSISIILKIAPLLSTFLGAIALRPWKQDQPWMTVWTAALALGVVAIFAAGFPQQPTIPSQTWRQLLRRFLPFLPATYTVLVRLLMGKHAPDREGIDRESITGIARSAVAVIGLAIGLGLRHHPGVALPSFLPTWLYPQFISNIFPLSVLPGLLGVLLAALSLKPWESKGYIRPLWIAAIVVCAINAALSIPYAVAPPTPFGTLSARFDWSVAARIILPALFAAVIPVVGDEKVFDQFRDVLARSTGRAW